MPSGLNMNYQFGSCELVCYPGAVFLIIGFTDGVLDTRAGRKRQANKNI